MQHSEPALLVGDTGTGKTTVCQMLTLMRGQKLHIINCNQHTETSDFLGGFRPVRSVCTLFSDDAGAELLTYICCRCMLLKYWSASSFPVSCMATASLFHVSCMVAALLSPVSCLVAALHAGRVGVFLQSGSCKHGDPNHRSRCRLSHSKSSIRT